MLRDAMTGELPAQVWLEALSFMAATRSCTPACRDARAARCS